MFHGFYFTCPIPLFPTSYKVDVLIFLHKKDEHILTSKVQKAHMLDELEENFLPLLFHLAN